MVGKHHHLLGKILLLLGAMLAVFALSTTDTSAKSKNMTTKIAKALNSDIENSDYGETTFTWDKKTKSFVATLDKNSVLYSQMNDGQVTNWDTLVAGLKSESKVLKKNGYSKYSGIQIINPDATDRSLLQIYRGKVNYNVRDDLQ